LGSQYGAPDDGQSLSDAHPHAPKNLLPVHTLEQQSLFTEQGSMKRLHVTQFFTRVFGAGHGPPLSHDCPLGAHVRMLFWMQGVVPEGQPHTPCATS
jgi:hypothetical protein